jgi:glycosyl transferase family 25
MASIDPYIDHIFYINLEKRTDRRTEIEQELLNHGLVGERFNAFKHTIGSVGCELSHLAVLKLAKERNYKNVLILEDDFQFLVQKEKFEKELAQFFNSQINYDVCFLAYNIQQSEDVPEYPFIKRAIESQTSSAYIINNHYYDKLINLFEKNVKLLENTNHHWLYAVDQVWKPLQKTDQWYYFTERIGKQRDGYSDNTERMEKYNC